MAMLAILILPLSILGFTAVAVVLPPAVASIGQPRSARLHRDPLCLHLAHRQQRLGLRRPHGNTLFYNITVGIAMFVGRFWMIVPVLAIAGSLAAKKIGAAPRPAPSRPHGGLFVGLLVGVILIVGGLTFFPALALGPIVEHLAMTRRHPVLIELTRSHVHGNLHTSRKRMPVSALFDPKILVPAIGAAFVKLDPRMLIKNPVMFVVEVVAALTTVIFIRDLVTGGGAHSASPSRSSSGSGSRCCSPTSPRRSPKAAARRRPTRCAASAPRPRPSCSSAAATSRLQTGARHRACKVGDVVLVEAGDIIPSDGEVIEGVASVNEAAITGESAPVIRESGGDRSAVTGGTQVLSDWIMVRITAAPGSTFLDRMIALVEGAERQKTPNEIALNILLAGLTIIFVFATATIPSFVDLCRRHDPDRRPGRAVRHADPDDDRRAAVGHRHRRHGPAGALQRARHVGPRRRGGGRRRHAAARQDRHDHARQPPGDRVPAGARRHRAASWPTRRSSPRSPTRRRKAARSSCWPRRSTASAAARWPSCDAKFIPFTAQTRMSGVDIDGAWIRKGAVDAILNSSMRSQPRSVPAARASAAAERTKPCARSTRSPRRSPRSGGTPLAVAKDGRLLGVIHLKDIVKGGIRERFAELRRMGIRTVMITGDNPLTAAAIAAEAGVDDFLAQATPEDKLKLIRDEQAKGKLVAMCGDGTNDAPALAQADVGVAMNTGTQAAREAGNMVDLDSDPTKLIEIVEIGKQLLMTRGALTTFSIANDVAKYFAIIPAMFARPSIRSCRRSTSCTWRRRRAPSCRRSSSTR